MTEKIHLRQLTRRARHPLAAVFLALLLTPPGFAAEPLENRHGTLLKKAEKDGHVSVIVHVNADFVPEGKLQEKSAVQQQRLNIQEAQERVLQELIGFDYSSVKRFKYIPYIAMKVDARSLRWILMSSEVLGIEEDVVDRLALSDTVPLVGAATVHSSGFSGARQAIAILDVGVDKTHPFLAGKVIAEACFSTTSGTSHTSLCPEPGIAAAPPCDPDVFCDSTDPDYLDCIDEFQHCCSHGTHVAGIAAGNRQPGPSGDPNPAVGIAPDAKIVAIQVFTRQLDFYGPGLGTRTSDQAMALEHVRTLNNDSAFRADNGIDGIAAVNMSLGSHKFSSPGQCGGGAVEAAIMNLRADGIPTIVASGNQGYIDSMNSPACIASAISVSSTTKEDEVSAFSNVADFLDFFAPGGKTPPGEASQYPFDIRSSVPSSLVGTNYVEMSGTSFATPHVAGAWAILKQAKPEATVDEILDALTVTGIPITDTRPDGSVTKPRIRIDAAVDHLLANCSPPVSGDWLVSADCTFTGADFVPSNIIVEPNVTLTLAAGSILQVDFASHHLLVRSGAKVVVKAGARLD